MCLKIAARTKGNRFTKDAYEMDAWFVRTMRRGFFWKAVNPWACRQLWRFGNFRVTCAMEAWRWISDSRGNMEKKS